jgi:hypothetical protein
MHTYIHTYMRAHTHAHMHAYSDLRCAEEHEEEEELVRVVVVMRHLVAPAHLLNTTACQQLVKHVSS